MKIRYYSLDGEFREMDVTGKRVEVLPLSSLQVKLLVDGDYVFIDREFPNSVDIIN